jgi:hypothetical protein
MVRQARVAGLLYLLVIAGGLFAEVFVRGSLIVPGDAAATAQEIAANESLWRWGLAVNLLYLLAAATINVLLYGLFKPVQAPLARIALALAVAAVAVEAMNLLLLYVPLEIADEGGALAALSAGQRQALTYLSVRLFAAGFAISLTLFAGFCVLLGVLIVRSWLLPHGIGVLMIAAGGCYLVNSLVFISAPGLSDVLVPWILLPCLVGELSLASWLAVKGVRTEATRLLSP